MTPFALPRRPLSGSRLALVTTGGVHLPGDERFDIDDPAGDCSYREIPTGAAELTWTHAYYARRRRPGDPGEDLDCVFPLWTLRGLVEEGVVGELNHRHLGFMGAIHDTSPLAERTAPEAAGLLLEDEVDAVLLTPSWPLCHRSVGLVASAIEERGIPTVTLSMERGMEAPRAAYVPFPYNFPMGGPGDGGRHREVALAALEMLRAEEPGEEALPFEWR